MGNAKTKSQTEKSVSRPKNIEVQFHHNNFSSHPLNSPSPASVTKPSAPPIKPPIPFMTEEEFFKGWNIWKKQFLKYITKSNQNSDKQQCGNTGDILLNLMGPIGQHIYSKFTFKSSSERENVDLLLDKFDEYSIFCTKKRLPFENVYEYVNDLQVIVKDKNISNVDETIRKKILKEIDEHQFTNVAKQLIPTFVFSSDFNKLTIKEIAFIWKLCVDKTCKQCGNNHITNKCPALDKQCFKCKKHNHFPRMCPENFIHKCKFCSGFHERKRCPAFNEICTKCQTLHHFSWQCQSGKILKCRFCDMSHAASRSVCPAKDLICGNCQKKGHITQKCRQTSGLHRN